jgi:hypothetical protein
MTLPTYGGRSIGIVRLTIKATEFSFFSLATLVKFQYFSHKTSTESYTQQQGAGLAILIFSEFEIKKRGYEISSICKIAFGFINEYVHLKAL